ncbi:hypothetical protein LCGC14_0622540 [marine sediment metagenome]|uniref:Uncharacterized protein n=1 Tax=marine sediment metagenome TaxID=412755 RepID=A0A0F9UCV7_9ZZZZ
MVKTNKVLKLLFICASLILLIVLLLSPKTHCQVCSLKYDGDTYDGYEAFELFEDACLSYSKPWDPEPTFNFTNITFTEQYLR